MRSGKLHSQQRWRASPKGKDYFRGSAYVHRVRAWREAILGYMVGTQILSSESGVLWLGDQGEKNYGRRHFMELLSCFTSPPLFHVLHGQWEIGWVDRISLVVRQGGRAQRSCRYLAGTKLVGAGDGAAGRRNHPARGSCCGGIRIIRPTGWSGCAPSDSAAPVPIESEPPCSTFQMSCAPSRTHVPAKRKSNHLVVM